MPTILGIPLIGFIQMVIGAAVVMFVLIKYLGRPKSKKDSFIIKNVHIITGDKTEKFNQNVYVSKGIIEKISDEPMEIKGVQIIDGEGKTLMPGLIDSHIHIQGMNSRSDEDSDRFLAEKIPEIFFEGVFPYGVTTIKDMCAPRHFAYKLRDMINKGKITGPELLIVGPNFTTPEGHPANTLGGENPWMRKEMAIEVSSKDDVTNGIAELKNAGIDFLKMTYQGGDYLYFGKNVPLKKLDKEFMRQIISEGKKNGLKTTAHVFYKEDVRELLEAGIYGIEHGILDEALSADDDILKLWKESGARFVPTVNAMTYENDPNRLPNSIHNLKLIYDAGIPIAMGTDTMLEAGTEESVQHELEYYVEAGLTPMQAIELATKNGAEHLGIADRKGLVKEGMEADLILLEKDPAKDISNIRFINKVFAKGKTVYSSNPIASYDIPEYSYPEGVTEIELVSEDGSERKVDVSRYSTDNEITVTIFKDGKVYSEEKCKVGKNLSAEKWSYVRTSDNTEVTAEKIDGYIHLTGTFKGKAQDKTFRIEDGLWYQTMDMAMPAFIASAQEEILFYSIGTGDNRGAMGLGEFAAKKCGEETVELNGKTYNCDKISFVLTQFSWAWTGYYWFDKQTGQMVQSGEKKGNAVTIKVRAKL
ncbi:MAG: amidohydrolase family protein [Oscillospiraceae bacterium]|nr:amidohydrolase family protein [Oscillospiraceae bacterium]